MTAGMEMRMNFNIERTSQGRIIQLTLQQEPINMKMSMKMFMDDMMMTKMAVKLRFSPKPLIKLLRLSSVDLLITSFLYSFSRDACRKSREGCTNDHSGSTK